MRAQKGCAHTAAQLASGIDIDARAVATEERPRHGLGGEEMLRGGKAHWELTNALADRDGGFHSLRQSGASAACRKIDMCPKGASVVDYRDTLGCQHVVLSGGASTVLLAIGLGFSLVDGPQ